MGAELDLLRLPGDGPGGRGSRPLVVHRHGLVTLHLEQVNEGDEASALGRKHHRVRDARFACLRFGGRLGPALLLGLVGAPVVEAPLYGVRAVLPIADDAGDTPFHPISLIPLSRCNRALPRQ